MSKNREISVFSLSLLDLLFCAFGGVIVLTVVFSAIIKYEQSVTESREVAIMLTVEYSNKSAIPGPWEIKLRQRVDDVNANLGSIEESSSVVSNKLQVFKSLNYFDEILQENHPTGKYIIGLSGELLKTHDENKYTDTLYIQAVSYPTDFGWEEELRTYDGMVSISMEMHKAGKLPENKLIAEIPASQFYKATDQNNQFIPLLFELEDNELKLSTY